MFSANGKLDIFENFQIDYNLLKYKRRRELEAKARAAMYTVGSSNLVLGTIPLSQYGHSKNADSL